MSEYRTILQRARDQFPAPEIPLDGLLRRRDRKQRNRRIGTATLAIVVAAAAIGGLVRAFHLTEAPRPASLPSTSDAWSRVVLEPGQVVNALSAGGPGLVAVGSDDSKAAVWTSTDGRTWSPVADLGGGDIRDVTVGGPGLVAVGTGDPVGLSVGAVWTSTDGLTWNRAPEEPVFDGALLQAVTAAGPGFVAVGTTPGGPQAWYSSDGLTWEEASVPPAPPDIAPDGDRASAFMFDLAAVGDRLIAVGEVGISCGEGCGRPKMLMWTSTDGIAWAKVPLDKDVFPRLSKIRSVAEGMDGLVAVGDDTPSGPVDHIGVWTSADGLSWSRAPSDQAAFVPLTQSDPDKGTLFGMWAIAVGSGGFVAAGVDGYCPGGTECPWSEAAVWTSANGRAWVRVPPGPVFQVGGTGWVSARTVASWGSRFVAGGEYGNRWAIWISEQPQG